MEDPSALPSRVEELLGELLRPQNRRALEAFRSSGSTNKVYRIPLGGEGQFIIVKLLPPWTTDLKVRVKRGVRNLLYGEHDLSVGRKRAQVEIERYREWHEQGMLVPTLIPTRFPDVRVFLGLPHPTFDAVLADPALPLARKLEVVRWVSAALSLQHKAAMESGKANLVHRDPGPRNILVDCAAEQVYWLDLEHPAAYHQMSFEAINARAVRVFLHGVLAHLQQHIDEVLDLFVATYELDAVLQRYVANMDKRRESLFYRSVERLRQHGSSQLLRIGIAEKVRARLEAKAAAQPSSSGPVLAPGNNAVRGKTRSKLLLRHRKV